MRYEFKKSYDRCIKDLPDKTKIEIKNLAFEVIDIFAIGKKPSKGVGLTRLRKDYWEARTNLSERILFKLKGDLLQFILVGNHNDVRRFLRHI
jgi:mRNA-degrading endonuclease YafQ of YafQ-DinJ toxin-antitoxin module